ncbi:hypothetical protein [Halobellus captivus]|uniref:hypothetical protein n=1 Tax=Halobellus captivus TaxID=2592614 RepID=UPI00119D32CB|nr:hypothetical protein [Halobellus captivus]
MVLERAIGKPLDRTDVNRESAARTAAHAEELHVRSYAHEWSYDLEIEIATPDGDVVFETQYHLRPGRAASEIGVVDPGEYDVRAVLDGERETVRRCRIDRTAGGTVVVEIGNGILSLTEGLRV